MFGLIKQSKFVGNVFPKFKSYSTIPSPPAGDSLKNNSPSNFNDNDGNSTQDPLSRYRYSLVRPIYSFILKSKLTADHDLARFLAKSGAVSIYSLAGMTALGTIGIDTSPILTGIGITGFTIGFALKEVATNFLSGVMLVFGKPFRKGQWLKVLTSTTTQLEGEVQSIDARYVLLRTKDKSLVMIPSVVVYTNPILVSNSANGSATTTSDSSKSSNSNSSNSSSTIKN